MTDADVDRLTAAAPAILAVEKREPPTGPPDVPGVFAFVATGVTAGGRPAVVAGCVSAADPESAERNARSLLAAGDLVDDPAGGGVEVTAFALPAVALAVVVPAAG